MCRFSLQKVVLGGLVAGMLLLCVASSAEAQLHGGLSAGFGIGGSKGPSTPAVIPPKQIVPPKQYKYLVVVLPSNGTKVYHATAKSRADAFCHWLTTYERSGHVRNVRLAQVYGGSYSPWQVSYTVTKPIYVKLCNTEKEARYLQKQYQNLGMRVNCQRR
jgi:hypothetical protein